MSETSNAETRNLNQSRRELWLILLAWLGCALWVIGYCAANGYDLAPEEVSTVLGFPGWVFGASSRRGWPRIFSRFGSACAS